MSLCQEEHLECPNCHQQFPFILHSSINVGLDPQDKAKVLDLSIFRYHCPHCGQSDFVCYPVLYHDPERELMVQVLWHEEEFGKPLKKDLQVLIEIMGQKNYRRREVFGYRGLVEKIRIFDAGLDDFAIALMKSMNKIQQPELQLFFDGKEGKQLKFLLFLNDTLLSDDVRFEEKAYEIALEKTRQWKKPHEFYESLRVDESYFYDDIVNAVRQGDPPGAANHGKGTDRD